MKVLAISGSLRSSSSTGALLRAAAQLGAPDMAFDLYESVGALPHFSPDLDVEPLPEPVAELRARVAIADALLIVSPEYAHGMPGSLKNALDWLVSDTRAFGKPTLLVSASPSGAPHAHAQLSEVLRTMSMALVDGGGHVFNRSRLNPRGEVSDPALLDALREGLARLAATPATRPEDG